MREQMDPSLKITIVLGVGLILLRICVALLLK